MVFKELAVIQKRYNKLRWLMYSYKLVKRCKEIFKIIGELKT